MKNSQGIEGVPAGVKVVSVWSQARKGQGRVCSDRTIKEDDPLLGVCGVVIEPDNVYDVLNLLDVPIPEGYRRKGNSPEEWFRVVGKDDWIVSHLTGCAIQIIGNDPCYVLGKEDCRRIIVEPIRKKKRVLVVVHELGEKEFPTDVGFFNPRDGNPASWIPVPKNKWRIEERDA